MSPLTPLSGSLNTGIKQLTLLDTGKAYNQYSYCRNLPLTLMCSPTCYLTHFDIPLKLNQIIKLITFIIIDLSGMVTCVSMVVKLVNGLTHNNVKQ